jgi:hypothetical protein
LDRYSANITKKYLMKFEKPYEYTDARIEITRLETPLDDLESLGDLIEDILLHNVPIQYHLPIAQSRTETLSETPGPITPGEDSPLLVAESPEPDPSRKRKDSLSPEPVPELVFDDEESPADITAMHKAKRRKGDQDNDGDVSMFGTS